ncbi:hypothetical protein BJ508DRAFT_312244 [Ascobolus immersus RN42]|uniref:Uncharacterized protein n=1 Tax=Ascobolus immersus RN42 TaxID=1160509 RepID=A0A3N4HSW7_ASCIM|nr:hypothetical protein BJ508DRAFT_312244 [Ascobolus immersus RN42]
MSVDTRISYNALLSAMGPDVSAFFAEYARTTTAETNNLKEQLQASRREAATYKRAVTELVCENESLKSENASLKSENETLNLKVTTIPALEQRVAQSEKGLVQMNCERQKLFHLMTLCYDDTVKVQTRVICDNYLRLKGYQGRSGDHFGNFKDFLVKDKPHGWQTIGQLLSMRQTLNSATHNRSFVSSAALLLLGDELVKEKTISPAMKYAHELCAKAFLETIGQPHGAIMNMSEMFQKETGAMPQDMMIGFDQPAHIGICRPEAVLGSLFLAPTPATFSATPSLAPTTSLVATAQEFVPAPQLPVAYNPGVVETVYAMAPVMSDPHFTGLVI